MDVSPGGLPADHMQPVNLPRLPRLWIGYLLGFATIVAEFVDASLHPPDAVINEIPIPDLYLFLLMFVGGVYWLVCVYRYHVLMLLAPGWKHPISPARAVGFHFIPIYNFYWVGVQVASGDCPVRELEVQRAGDEAANGRPHGLRCFHHAVLLDPGLGLILLFLAASYVSGCLRRAFALPVMPTLSRPPSAE